MIKRVVGVHFSPMGKVAAITDKVAEELAAGLAAESAIEVRCESCEINNIAGCGFDEETVVVVGMPSCIGKLPLPGLSAIREIRGNGAMMIGLVTFGTRSCGNALYEMLHYAEEQGFVPVGAGSFSIKEGREEAMKFCEAACGKLKRLAGSSIDGLRITPAPLDISGKLPVHTVSRFSPKLAEAAERLREKISFGRERSEWYL